MTTFTAKISKYMTMMNKTNRVFLALVVWTMATVAQAQTMTLGECIRMGVERNLQLQSQRIDIDKGETQIRQSRAMLLPQINGSLQIIDYLKYPVQVSGSTLIDMDFPDQMQWGRVRTMQYTSQLMVQAQVPLYNQSILDAIKAAKVVKQLHTLAYDKAVETLTVQIAKVYYAAQSCKEQYRLLDEDVQRMTELASIAKAMLTQGVILETDYTRISINITNLETLRAQYQMVYEQQLNTLRFLLDMEATDAIDVERMEASLPPVPRQGMNGLLPDQQLLDAQHLLTEKQIKLTRAGYLPSIGLFAQGGFMGYQEKFGDFFKKFNNRQFGMAALGLQVNIPIFDANDKRLKIRQYRYDAEKIKTNRQLLDASLTKDYTNATLQLSQNEQIFTTQSQNREQAQRVYDLTARRYKEGVASMTELLQDDMRLISSEQDMVNAHLQYNLALIDFLRLENNLGALK